MLVQDKYFTVAVYDLNNKKFLGTTGGTYTAIKDRLTIHHEFNTMDSTKVGTSATHSYTLQKDKGKVTSEGKNPKETEN